ncbi:MAG: ABC-type transporter, periplasmic subunit [Cyanobacteria bacterium RYN_339]|nr:ABC-type transporter, periplasmic subunit [Cyanobacteria bacterium RYN_339]
MRHSKRTLAFLAAACVAASGCSPQGKVTDNGSTVVFQQQQEPDKLNPVISDMMATIDATTPMLEGLVQVDDQMRFFPQLAAKVPTLENGLVAREGKGMVVTYPLRPNVKWHDGQPFTAEDVQFTWQVYMNEKTMVTSKTGYDKITAVEILDPHTVKMHFKEIFSPYLGIFSTILPKHVLAKDLASEDSINKSAFNQHPIGTGPFKFKEWVSGDHLTMVRFDDYYINRPHIAAIKMRIVPDENAAFTLLKSGELDIYQSAAIGQYDAIKRLTNVKVSADPGLTYEHLDFNMQKPKLKDKRVRQAVAYAINRKQISEKIYSGLYPVAYADLCPMSWAYPKPLENSYAYNPDKSKQLLEEAGWKLGPDGIRVYRGQDPAIKPGERLSFTITSTAGRKPRELTELVFRHYFKQVGMELVIDNQPGSTMFAGYPDGTLKGGKFDIALYAQTAPPDPDADYSVFHSSQIPGKGNNGQNNAHYKSQAVDDLLVQGQLELAQDKRAAIYLEMEKHVMDDLPIFPLLYWATLNPYNKRLMNFKANPSNAGNLWNTWEWDVQSPTAMKASKE